ncbi:MAG: ATP-binding protein [Pseudomonadales bacterium]|nr:ATP-binding protein [Pseudomonadales bacterium]NRA16750.1 response regulator [Oceanospirillaceae bacterium]
MPALQQIVKTRRTYNQWVANQTLEDYALRFTAHKGRLMSIERVAKTAIGATAFLALEGIAAAVTLSYGFTNTLIAMFTVALLFFIISSPIAYYCAKHGLDIDLLTRGAGFGYLGSTITSLIYASFTFIFFAIEAAILASALQALLGIPLQVGYLLCAVAVIPIVTHGIKTISKFQLGTQNLWLLLQFTALVTVIYCEYQQLDDWSRYTPSSVNSGQHFDIMLFGAAASVFFALVAQIGEQVDYLRFMPQKTAQNKRRWWFWLMLAGPGWIIIGLVKMLLGSFLAYLAISQGVDPISASDPSQMYYRVFSYLTNTPSLALFLAALMVIISQLKINVTNAYAGSIAWSNFFSRLTHSHPGRVVWLVFNVVIALLLMELGIYQVLESILGIFAIVAVSWLGSVCADLLINKPLGLSPKEVEFKRAHLYDINPVGCGSMLLSTSIGLLCYLGLFGAVMQNLGHFISLMSCFILVPLIAWLTKGRFYLARQSPQLIPLAQSKTEAMHNDPLDTATVNLNCGICEHDFEAPDMSYCPAYALPICSLCCTLEVRCLDSCKPKARISQQLVDFLALFLSAKKSQVITGQLGRFLGLLAVVNLLNAALLAVIYRHMQPLDPSALLLLEQTLWIVFVSLLIVSGVLCWLLLLAHDSRRVAQQESSSQTQKLTLEIQAHQQTDLALQQAKELAERASAAKSRYLTGISHELRTPLQSILGYAQLLLDKVNMPREHHRGLQIIHRNGQYLTDLIEGLLDISKIEAGRLDLYRSQVRLPELLTQMVDMFNMQARSKGISLHYQPLSKLPEVVICDEKRLRQILNNLLSNAIKYTTRGSVEFSVRYRNQVAEFIIRDTGIGIDAEALERIFHPFERVRDSHSSNLPGTGLGLTIVKLLAEIMGGDLQVESTLGQGSCFKVSLMLPWATQQGLEKKNQKKIAGYEGYQRSLLLVDDDPVVRGLFSELLMPLGFRILEAQSGEKCLQMLEETDVDFILLDINMPGINGLKVAQQLRQRNIKTPIVMLSADVQEQHGNIKSAYGYDGYLIKPVANALLLETIASHLEINWVYQSVTPVDPKQDNVPVPIAAQALVIPDHALLLELKACAQMGYHKGASELLTQIAELSILSPNALSQLQLLCTNFQFEQLAKALEISSDA